MYRGPCADHPHNVIDMPHDSHRTTRPARARRPPPAARRRGRRRAIALVSIATAVVVLALAAAGGPREALDRARRAAPVPTITLKRPARVERLVVGRGARAALIVRRDNGRAQPVVIFLHGWEVTGSAAYRAWLTHLARVGATVIAPRYQIRNSTPPEQTLDNVLAGVRSALRRVQMRGDTVTVAGHSAGGALAADYAAVAAREGLPPASRVLAIYPGSAIRGTNGVPVVDAPLPPETRLVVMASPADQVVGTAPAEALVAAARAVPTAQSRLVMIDQGPASDHFGPVLNSPAARRTFWRELDRMLPLP